MIIRKLCPVRKATNNYLWPIKLGKTKEFKCEITNKTHIFSIRKWIPDKIILACLPNSSLGNLLQTEVIQPGIKTRKVLMILIPHAITKIIKYLTHRHN